MDYAKLHKRAKQAIATANYHNYTSQYDEDSLLAELCRLAKSGEAVSDAGVEYADRYLVIATEYGGEGPADWSDFFSSKKAAMAKMTKYAREGWASSLWDLDKPSILPIHTRVPR